MTEDELKELAILVWMPKRVPCRAALVTFVPDKNKCPEAIREVAEKGPCRWFPEADGHRVVILYQGGPYDTSIFTLDESAWDHDHCDVCCVRIPPMTLFFVTEGARNAALCIECHGKYVEK